MYFRIVKGKAVTLSFLHGKRKKKEEEKTWLVAICSCYNISGYVINVENKYITL